MVANPHPSPPILAILGGGQLARMLVQAATQLGCITKVLDPDPQAPAMALAGEAVVGDWRDPAVLLEFARGADAVTLENEFIDAARLRLLTQAGAKVRPSPETVGMIQDKLTQRQVFARAGLPVPPFVGVSSVSDVSGFAARVGWPLMLKLRRNGYDGKGNAAVRDANDVARAWQDLSAGDRAVYAEAWCPLVRELAVIVCRAVNGAIAIYPVVETVQENHICRIVRAPAAISSEQAAAAETLARRAVEAVDGVGCFGIELFELADGTLVLNEVSPRVHNSGHYSIEACTCSQFENHVRAVLGLPLGSTSMRTRAATMINLLGAGAGSGQPAGLETALSVPGAHVHVYGKRLAARGRKMGHVTVLGDDPAGTFATANRAAEAIRFGQLS